MAGFPGITHVALTVTDLDRSVPWYQALIGSDPVLDQDTGPFRHVVWTTDSGSLVSLHGFAKGTTDPKDRFSEFRVGMDHLRATGTLARIDEKIVALRQQLTGSTTDGATPPQQKARRKMSAAARARIVAAQRARWAATRRPQRH